MNGHPDHTAMVLSGGGAYGAFAVGVMKTLFAGRSPASGYQPVTAKIFTGTSVGAFNAAMMVCQGQENNLEAVLQLEKVWLDLLAEKPGGCGNRIFRFRGNPAEYLDPNCYRAPATLAARFASDGFVLSSYLLGRTANFLADSSSSLPDRAVGLINIGSFVDTDPYREMLRSLIDEKDIRESPLHLRIVATNWVTGRAKYFENDDFENEHGLDAIRASTSIPGIFPPVTIGTDLFVDGGVVENTPLQPAIELKATILHVIYLDPKPEFIRLKGQPNTLETMLRVYYLMLAAKLNEDVETSRWINAGLKALDHYQETGSVTNAELTDFVKVAGQLLKKRDTGYNRLIIHRYFPRSALGGNFGMLDFRVDPVARMIEEGEHVALVHDCNESACVTD